MFSKHKDREGDAHDGLLIEYIDPTSGQPVFKTITFFAQMLQPAQKTLPVRTTSNLLVSPFEGQGYSMVEGKRYDWKEFDTIAIPGGSWYEHHNASPKEPLFLFVASDEPTLKKLGLYQKWGKDAAGAVGRLE